MVCILFIMSFLLMIKTSYFNAITSNKRFEMQNVLFFNIAYLICI